MGKLVLEQGSAMETGQVHSGQHWPAELCPELKLFLLPRTDVKVS